MSASYLLKPRMHSSIWKANRAALTRDEDCATAAPTIGTAFRDINTTTPQSKHSSAIFFILIKFFTIHVLQSCAHIHLLPNERPAVPIQLHYLCSLIKAFCCAKLSGNVTIRSTRRSQRLTRQQDRQERDPMTTRL
ncbi:uncharacterized protein PHALS_07672 [Plasmopara halstedii]|uniref:Uncharacterized protein n=1 Tax=Plasmopara halstedii TaxID=4781 RepID=A0A0P1B7U2_PLAHL|nr:uncharacterized protein PHALS_07672 [Plasmopara halstedii]CEG49937.1 hypothetical protein PHALS_07672 [Plasmopara halstedii]|eukprot:XP_024586306.1 hypothetical protein PHALS_07672 [Plasmopara halstedii]